jgi:hypothetical protein
VRCVRCRAVWFAHEAAAIADAAPAWPGDAALAPAPEADIVEAAAESAPPAGTMAGAFAPDVGGMPRLPPAETSATPDPQWREAAPPPMAEPAGGEAVPQLHAPIGLADPAPLTLAEPGSRSPAAAVMSGEDIETVAARRARAAARRRLAWPLPNLPTAIMALLALNAVLIGWRADVVRIAPQMASLYAAIGLPVNLRGLVFANVATTTETQDGVPVLVVEGTIASRASRPTEVPRLRFSVRNRHAQEIYAWTALPNRSLLAPGETLEFRSRLASPPPDGEDVAVRFFSRRDLVAGLQ